MRRGTGIAVAVIAALTLSLQGCLGAVWLAAVGSHVTMGSDIEFLPFENSWVAPPEMRGQSGSVESIAVAPFDGDPSMATRFVTVLERGTALRVVTPIEVGGIARHEAMPSMSESSSGQKESRLAQEIARDAGVDCVLFGTVVPYVSNSPSWGPKIRYSKRLLLLLVSEKGDVIWKDELPFTVMTDAAQLSHEGVNDALKTHLTAHVSHLGLTELGLVSGRAEGIAAKL
jgi:hypothetical protein